MGAVMANIVGYYPWFATYNQMEESLPKTDADGKPFTGGRAARDPTPRCRGGGADGSGGRGDAAAVRRGRS